MKKEGYRANLWVGLFAGVIALWPGGTPTGDAVIGVMALVNLALYFVGPRL